MSGTRPLHRHDRAAKAHLDALLDEALQETFPASDAIAVAADMNSLGADTRPRAGIRAIHASQARHLKQFND